MTIAAPQHPSTDLPGEIPAHVPSPSNAAAEALKPYVLALLLVAVAVAVRVAVLPAVGDPGLVFWLLPILVSTRWGGLGPGIFATLLVGAGTMDLSVLRAPAWLSHPVEPGLRWGIFSLGVMVSAIVEQQVRVEPSAPATRSENSGAWLQAATDQLQEGLVVASLSGDLLHANRLGLEAHGLEGGIDSIVDRSDCLQVFLPSEPPVRLEPADWPLARVLRGEELSALDLVVHRRDLGSARRLRYSGRIVAEVGTERRLAVVTIQDVTAPSAVGTEATL